MSEQKENSPLLTKDSSVINASPSADDKTNVGGKTEMGGKTKKCDFAVKAIFTMIIIICWIVQLVQFSLLIFLMDLPETNASNTSALRMKTDNLINLTSYFIRCFEPLILLHGMYLFSTYKFGKKDGSICAKIRRCCCSYDEEDFEMWKTVKEEIYPSTCTCTDCCNHVTLIVIAIIHLVISFLPPIILISWPEENIEFYSRNPAVATTRAGLAFVSFFCNFLMRTIMAYITLFVMSTWKIAAKDVEQEIIEEVEDDNTVIEKLVKKYHSTGKKVNAVQQIFQGWFVVKWVVYFINISGDSILAAGILFGDNRHGDEYEKRQLTSIFILFLSYLVYDFGAFFFLFFCGSFMNHYHAFYRKEQAEVLRERLSKSSNACFNLMQGLENLISEVPEYQFLPTLLWIDFPLNSPGYILTMLLALVAFIAKLMTQYSY